MLFYMKSQATVTEGRHEASYLCDGIRKSQPRQCLRQAQYGQQAAGCCVAVGHLGSCLLGAHLGIHGSYELCRQLLSDQECKCSIDSSLEGVAVHLSAL